jgi:hypothetical protein
MAGVQVVMPQVPEPQVFDPEPAVQSAVQTDSPEPEPRLPNSWQIGAAALQPAAAAAAEPPSAVQGS